MGPALTGSAAHVEGRAGSTREGEGGPTHFAVAAAPGSLTKMEGMLLLAAVLLSPQEPSPAPAPELPLLAAPVRVEAAGKPIEAVIGHAAPFVVDCDGDGVRDLVVGMFGNDGDGASGGTARIYKNVGTNQAPRFADCTTLLADGKPASMESS